MSVWIPLCFGGRHVLKSPFIRRQHKQKHLDMPQGVLFFVFVNT